MPVKYSYSQHNLLEQPEKYMYTQFEGDILFKSYFEIRNKFIKRSKVNIANSSSLIVQLTFEKIIKLFSDNFDNGSQIFKLGFEGQKFNASYSKQLIDEKSIEKNKINFFSNKDTIDTLTLLQSLFFSIISDENSSKSKVWINHLIQRFEVTKKIYKEYLPGFKKGHGENNIIRLYWLFAIVLCLYYAKNNEIKYLSTLIKLCDLIISLPFKYLNNDIPESGLYLLLTLETIFVKELIIRKKIEYSNE